MNLGRILVVNLALFGLVNIAQANYERTLDGKVKVWHNTPQRRVEANWSGDRDEKGYATGKGTLTWFRIKRIWETGSLLPRTKYIQVSQYKGKMVEGKLEGSVVSVDTNGNTFHAKFADGEKTGDWIAGAGRSSHKHAEPETAAAKAAESPAEAPSPAPKLSQHAAPKEPDQSAPTKETESVPATESSPHAEDSLQALAKPPSSLRIGSASEPSPQPSAPTVEMGEAAAASSSPSSSLPATPASAESSVQSDDARAVAALDSEFQAAVKINDATTIDRILADDFVLVHGEGQTFTKTDVVKQARDKKTKYERHDVEEGSQKVRVWHDTAVVTETLWVKGSVNGQPVDQKMSVTETYVRTPNGWRYVSGQASIPAK